MEKYLRKLQQLKYQSHGSHGDGGSRAIKKFKKIIIIAAIVGIVGFIALVVLAIVAVTWLVNRGGDEVRQAGQSVIEQVPGTTVPSLDLSSYVVGDQVNTEQLEQAFNAVPAQLQDAWLGQFQNQIDALQNQAGISDETINSLTSLYNTFQTLQGEQ